MAERAGSADGRGAGAAGRRAAANAALALLSALAALAAGEVALRGLDVVPDYWDWHHTRVELDPELLYRLRGHSRPDLNSLGYRDAEFTPLRTGRTRIAMVGDSFLFGDNVGPQQTLPALLERRLGAGYEVLNLGIPGDGPDQSLARLRRDGLRFDPDGVVLAIYAANDFNDLAKNRLYVVDARGEVVENPRNPVREALPWLRSGVLLRKWLTGRGLDPALEERLNAILGADAYDPIVDPDAPDARHKIALMRGVLRRFRDTLAARGIRFWVLVIPSLENVQDDRRFREWGVPPEAYTRNEAIAAALCREEGIEVVELLPAFLAERGRALFTPGDGHLTVAGNRLAARRLAAALVDAGSGVR